MNNILRFNANKRLLVNSILYNEYNIENERESERIASLKLEISRIKKLVSMMYCSDDENKSIGVAYDYISRMFSELNMEVIHDIIIQRPHKNVLRFIVEDVSRRTYIKKTRPDIHFMPYLRFDTNIYYLGDSINEKIYVEYNQEYKEFVDGNYLEEPFEEYNYANNINLSKLVRKLLGDYVNDQNNKRKKIVVQLIRNIFGDIFEDFGNMIVYMPSAKYSSKPILKDVIFVIYLHTNFKYHGYFSFSIRSKFKVTNKVDKTKTVTITYDVVSTILTSPENSYLFTSVGKQYERTIKNIENDIKFDEKFLESYNRKINLENYISREELYKAVIPVPEEKYTLVPFL
ncbi:MAG: hypothetical protein QXF12_05390 [Candidatus Aenigmatarchaeota archaeon]